MFHLLAYTNTLAGAATLQAATAAVDPSFTTQNSNYIFTDQLRLLAAYGTGALNTAAQFNVPSWNAISPLNIYPWNLSITTPANAQIMDWTNAPPLIPLDEQVGVQMTATGAEQENLFAWVGTPNWTKQISQYLGIMSGSDSNVGRRIYINCTFAVVKVANTWSADGAVTFQQALRGGTYAVLGAYFFVAGVLAARMNFVRQKQYDSRKLYPGDICYASYSQVPWRAGPNWLGAWGAFHTFEPPLLNCWGNAAGAATVTAMLDAVYLGRSENLVDSFYQSMAV